MQTVIQLIVPPWSKLPEGFSLATILWTSGGKSGVRGKLHATSGASLVPVVGEMPWKSLVLHRTALPYESITYETLMSQRNPGNPI